MTLRVYTKRLLRYSPPVPDELDITRGSGREGLFLAPSPRLFADARVKLRAADQVGRMGSAAAREQAALLRLDAWRWYEPLYLAEMVESQRLYASAWKQLLQRPRVVLACYCEDAEHCHRWLLRTQVLPALGAIDRGELRVDGPEPRQRSLPW